MSGQSQGTPQNLIPFRPGQSGNPGGAHRSTKSTRLIYLSAGGNVMRIASGRTSGPITRVTQNNVKRLVRRGQHVSGKIRVWPLI